MTGIWRREGLRVPHKRKKHGRLDLNNGSCVRRKPEHPNHVRACDFRQDRTSDGRACRALDILHGYGREALMIRVHRPLNATDVPDALTDLFIQRGPPRFIGSDNGPRFIARKLRERIEPIRAKTASVDPGSP
ncbi:integrase core domain protein [Rhodovulum sulfidophilum]|uniref:Integrase core domain protein n=1 Tax=Rhodovulum sulfidophilum TaxID=35806 RepID=A0A0D6B609_RHOSU|nr:integrase core domain protein [Rhodovulum sulfidophilum]